MEWFYDSSASLPPISHIFILSRHTAILTDGLFYTKLFEIQCFELYPCIFTGGFGGLCLKQTLVPLPSILQKLSLNDLCCRFAVAQSCPTLCDPMGCRDFPGRDTGVGYYFLLQGILPNQTRVSRVSCISRRFLYHCATCKALKDLSGHQRKKKWIHCYVPSANHHGFWGLHQGTVTLLSLQRQ